MTTHPIKFMTKAMAKSINGGLTTTSKMPCDSYSLPTLACQTGYAMSKVEGSVCSKCYANKGYYRMYEANILPAQMARLDSITSDDWVDSMVTSIGSSLYFRWHDSGDLQGLDHLRKIVAVCLATPNTKHWLPTREFKTISDYVKAGGVVPANLTIRLSAMYPDKAVTIPKVLQGIRGVTASNVHTAQPMGQACTAPEHDGKCLDCRACWTDAVISYAIH